MTARVRFSPSPERLAKDLSKIRQELVVKEHGRNRKSRRGKTQVSDSDTMNSRYQENRKQTLFWAHLAEDKINGLLQQVEQAFPDDEPFRILLKKISEDLGDFIHNQG